MQIRYLEIARRNAFASNITLITCFNFVIVIDKSEINCPQVHYASENCSNRINEFLLVILKHQNMNGYLNKYALKKHIDNDKPIIAQQLTPS